MLLVCTYHLKINVLKTSLKCEIDYVDNYYNNVDNFVSKYLFGNQLSVIYPPSPKAPHIPPHPTPKGGLKHPYEGFPKKNF
jgi:hypothetical protein